MLKSKFTWLVVGLIFLALGTMFALELAARPREIKLRVTGMSCSGCAENVQAALQKVPGVTAVKVEILNPPATDAASPSVAATTGPNDPLVGRATVTIAGLGTPDQAIWEAAIKQFAGDQFRATLE